MSCCRVSSGERVKNAHDRSRAAVIILAGRDDHHAIPAGARKPATDSDSVTAPIALKWESVGAARELISSIIADGGTMLVGTRSALASRRRALKTLRRLTTPILPPHPDGAPGHTIRALLPRVNDAVRRVVSS
jgi:hypothetical protein